MHSFYERKFPISPYLNKFDSIVWLQTGFLGDIILTTAAMNLVKKKFPSKKQFLITTELGKKALDKQTYIDEIYVLEKKTLSSKQFIQFSINLGKKIHQNSSSPVILQPHLSYRSSFLALMLGMPRITYFETKLNFGAKKVSRIAIMHEAYRIGLLLEALGITREEIMRTKPFLKPLPLRSDFPFRENIYHNSKKIIGIAPGSVWPTKRWDVAKFAELMRNLLESTDFHIVLLGSKNEESMFEALPRSIINSAKVINLMGRTKLEDLPGLYDQFALIVSNDSSPIHYASAIDIPTVTIFQATTAQMGFAPLSSQHTILEDSDLECRPCGLHGHTECPLGHFKCMKNIDVKSVFEAVIALTNTISGPKP